MISAGDYYEGNVFVEIVSQRGRRKKKEIRVIKTHFPCPDELDEMEKEAAQERQEENGFQGEIFQLAA